ncbi:HEPN domain-containing protein [Ralstonia nicotianae]|nr:hypothetical protein [Ralstonia solanacearum]
MADFDLALRDFQRQTSVLVALLSIVGATGDQLQSPTLPPGGQNTMTAAAIVLLAAHFEEYIRQQVQEYASNMVQEYEHLTEIERERFTDAYWRGGTGRLSRIRPKGDPLWMGGAERHLRSLIAFPIGGNTTEFSPPLVSEHENNMRWDTIAELAGRIGLRKLGETMFSNGDLRSNVGAGGKNDFEQAIQRRLNEFYHRRNEIVHSIAQTAGIGASVFTQWVEFLLLIAHAFAQASKDGFAKFQQDIQTRKDRAERRNN